MKDKCFFIDLRGRIVKYRGDNADDVISFHYEIAKQEFPEMEYPDDYVRKIGWVTIGSSVYAQPIIDKNPTQRQIDTLFDLGLLDKLLIRDGSYYIKFQ